jgi:hypothetical protein
LNYFQNFNKSNLEKSLALLKGKKIEVKGKDYDFEGAKKVVEKA